MPDEDVTPGREAEGVGQVVDLFAAEVTRRDAFVPDVPLVEADRGTVGRVAGCDAGEVDEGGGHFDGALGGARCGDVGEVSISLLNCQFTGANKVPLSRVLLLVIRVDVDGVHIDVLNARL